MLYACVERFDMMFLGKSFFWKGHSWCFCFAQAGEMASAATLLLVRRGIMEAAPSHEHAAAAGDGSRRWLEIEDAWRVGPATTEEDANRKDDGDGIVPIKKKFSDI